MSATNVGTVSFTFLIVGYLSELTLFGSFMSFSALTLVGYLFKAMLEYGYIYLVIGQFLLGISGSLLFNTEMKFFSTWFDKEHIKKVFSFTMIINMIGKGAMNVFPYVFVKESAQTGLEQKKETRDFFFVMAFGGLIGVLLTLLLLKEIPPKDYGLRIIKEDKKGSLEDQTVGVELKKLLTNILFLKYLVMLSLIIFAMSFVSNTINLVAIRFGCSQDSGSWAMFTFYLLGFTGTLIYDYFFLKLKRNRFFLLLYTSIGLANKLLNDHPCLYQHFHGSLPPIFCMLCLIRIFPYEQAAPGL